MSSSSSSSSSLATCNARSETKTIVCQECKKSIETGVVLKCPRCPVGICLCRDCAETKSVKYVCEQHLAAAPKKRVLEDKEEEEPDAKRVRQNEEVCCECDDTAEMGCKVCSRTYCIDCFAAEEDTCRNCLEQFVECSCCGLLDARKNLIECSALGCPILAHPRCMYTPLNDGPYYCKLHYQQAGYGTE
jgi:hypothetical protein